MNFREMLPPQKAMGSSAIKTLIVRSTFGLVKKVAKYRDGYLAVDHRRAFIRAIVSTSGRILRDLLRVLYILADIKTTQFFSDVGDKDFSNEAFR
jgi:hypothetical protein